MLGSTRYALAFSSAVAASSSAKARLGKKLLQRRQKCINCRLPLTNSNFTSNYKQYCSIPSPTIPAFTRDPFVLLNPAQITSTSVDDLSNLLIFARSLFLHEAEASIQALLPPSSEQQPSFVSFADALIEICSQVSKKSPSNVEEFVWQLLSNYERRQLHHQIIASVLVLSRAERNFEVSGRAFISALVSCIKSNTPIADIGDILVTRLMISPNSTLAADINAWNALLYCHLENDKMHEFQLARKRIHNAGATPNGTTTALLAASYIRRGDESTANALLLDEFNHSGSKKPEIAALASSVLYALAITNQSEQVTTLRRIIQNNSHRIGRLGARATTTVMSMYLHESNVTAALAVSREFIPYLSNDIQQSNVDILPSFIDKFDRPDAESLQRVLQPLCRERRLSELGQSYLDVVAASQVRWFHVIVAQLGSEGRFTSIIDVMSHVWQNQSPTAGTFIVALKTFSKVPSELTTVVSERLTIFYQELLKPRSLTETDSLSTERWKSLVSALSTSLQSGMGIIEHGPRKALAMKMTDLRIEPRWPSRLLLAVNWAFESSTDLPELVARLFTLPPPDEVTEDKLLDTLASKGFSREIAFTFQHLSGSTGVVSIREYLQLMESVRIAPTMYSFSVLMKKAIQSNDLIGANLLFHRMLDLRIAASGPAEHDAYRDYFTMLGRVDPQLSQTQPAIERMLSSGVRPTEKLASDILSKAFSVDQLLGWRLWDSLHASGLPPSPAVYGVVLNHLASIPKDVSWIEFNGSYTRMFQLLEPTLSKLKDRATRNVVEAPFNSAYARGAAVRGEIKIALKYTAKLPASLYSDRVARYSEIAGALAESGKHTIAFKIVRKLYDSGYVPRTAIYTLLSVYLHLYDPEYFSRVVNMMTEMGIQPDNMIYKRLIMAAGLFSEGRVEPLQKTWEMIKRSGLAHDRTLMEAMVASHAKMMNFEAIADFYHIDIRPLILFDATRVPHLYLASNGPHSDIMRVAGVAFSSLVRGGSVATAMKILADCLNTRRSIPIQWWASLSNYLLHSNAQARIAATTSSLDGANIFSHQLKNVVLSIFYAISWFKARNRMEEAIEAYKNLEIILRLHGQYRVPPFEEVSGLLGRGEADNYVSTLEALRIQSSSEQSAVQLSAELNNAALLPEKR